PHECGWSLSSASAEMVSGARARTARVTASETASLTAGRTRGPMPDPTAPGPGSLPEPFPLRFEQVVLGQPPGEAQEPGVGNHPVRWPHAAAAHGPPALEQLERLQHSEAAELAEAVEEPLHLADVRAVGEHDPTRP